ncbi:hypothetical protein CLOM_g7284, partial [Closterium sp. NIES-68]
LGSKIASLKTSTVTTSKPLDERTCSEDSCSEVRSSLLSCCALASRLIAFFFSKTRDLCEIVRTSLRA